MGKIREKKSDLENIFQINWIVCVRAVTYKWT